MTSVHLENGEVTVRSIPKPRVPRGSSLIRLLYGGICNTDLELRRGYYGFRGTPGHEFVGVVSESADRGLLGKRVVGEINLACGRCAWCRRGLERHCPNRSVLGIVKHPGAFREYLTLPNQNLHVVPDEIADEQAVFAEPLAAACEVRDQVKIPRGAAVAILGDGKLGLLISQVLHAHGAKVHLYGKHREKLRIAEAVGIATEAARTLPAARYQWVVEATGSQEGLKQAIGMTRPRGMVIMKSTVHGVVEIDTAPVIVNELTLVGSRCGRFEPALKLLRSGKVRVDNMISEVWPLEQASRAFARAERKGMLKVLLRAG